MRGRSSEYFVIYVAAIVVDVVFAVFVAVAGSVVWLRDSQSFTLA